MLTPSLAGPEYGTTEAAWKAVLNEADRRCELHLRVKDNLVNDVIQSIKNWQKDNYHKQLMQIKEKKELDDQFKRAQKPWVKLLEKVEKAKSSYHIACKNEKSAVNQERNATKDFSLSQDSVRLFTFTLGNSFLFLLYLNGYCLSDLTLFEIYNNLI